jgi:heme-degrading monooxygenase HmoA
MAEEHNAITTVQVQPDKVDELIRLYKEMAQATQAQGLKGARLLTNRATGKVLIIGRWEAEADAKAFESSPTFQAAAANLGAMLTAPPTREYYEVSLEYEVSAT